MRRTRLGRKKGNSNRKQVTSQAGFQTDFLLANEVDIVIGGGAAGVGKSFIMLVDFLRDVPTKGYDGVIFRRTSPEITNNGGLWDESAKLFNVLAKNRPTPTQGKMLWTFPSGAKLKFSHLQHEKDKYSWQGSQSAFIGYDELTHFLRSQFFYLLSRNRSTCGVKPRVRATTNPQGQGWVKDLIQWWLYPDDYEVEHLVGYPIPERVGVVRYMTQYKSKYVWGNTVEEVLDKLPASVAAAYAANGAARDNVKSVTFIPGKLDDNKILQAKTPSYKGSLLALDAEEQEQLLKGRWINLQDDENKLYDYKSLQCLFTNDFVPHGKAYLTCDIAFEGADSFVVCVWSGFRLEKIYTFEKTDGKEVYEYIKQLAKKHKVPARNIAFDANGSGNFLKGFMRASVAFLNNGKALEVNGLKIAYDNLKTQCYYMLRQKINDFELFVNVENEQTINRILDELHAVEKRPKKPNGNICVSSKKEQKLLLQGKSPDIADCILMRMVFEMDKYRRSGSGKVTFGVA